MKVEDSAKFIPVERVQRDNGRSHIPKPYLDIAENLETQFSDMMFKAMEKTTGKDEGSTAEEYYNSLLNEQRSKLASNDEGMGIKKIILDQIYPQKFRTKENLDAYSKSQAHIEATKIKRGVTNEHN